LRRLRDFVDDDGADGEEDGVVEGVEEELRLGDMRGEEAMREKDGGQK
jgi:hypothetical protein